MGPLVPGILTLSLSFVVALVVLVSLYETTSERSTLEVGTGKGKLLYLSDNLLRLQNARSC